MRAVPGKRLLVFSVLILIALICLGYFKLGGFNKIKIELVEVGNYHLAGRYFEGSYRSDTVSLYFNEMKDLLEGNDVEGYPAIIYQQEPQGTQGLSKIFVGILPKSSEMQFNLPPEVNLTSKEITASVAIRISKEAHISVMPNPEKIHELIESFANEHRLKVGDLDIEIYHTHNRLVIERPVLQTKSLEVTATAFNSISSQTNKDHASITAWGDELKPGMKCIAVSRDLIQMGLTHGTEVEITGLSDTYKVLDKMNKRWEKRIDIYMGNDEEAARQWGKKQVTISWR